MPSLCTGAGVAGVVGVLLAFLLGILFLALAVRALRASNPDAGASALNIIKWTSLAQVLLFGILVIVILVLLLSGMGQGAKPKGKAATPPYAETETASY